MSFTTPPGIRLQLLHNAKTERKQESVSHTFLSKKNQQRTLVESKVSYFFISPLNVSLAFSFEALAVRDNDVSMFTVRITCFMTEKQLKADK